MNYGAVIGTPPHLSGEMFKHITGANIVFVPYKSAAQATTDVLAGQMNMTFEGTTGSPRSSNPANCARWR